MFIVGLCIHLFFLFSIFDIYFKSPIVQNVPPYKAHHEPLADRLILFVVDGLRAESFVNYTTMPYLRSIANSYGRWGVSHTRVPTESRPGHVAVIAGFYEDPSAVAKGWKENPVDFDSVFNQTLYTWCWGTYDILDIFTKGSTNDHIFVEKLDPYDHTFSTDKNTTQLDNWVFEKVKIFFNEAKYNKVLYERVMQRRISFFLHLLGTDTSGHTHKPNTLNYLTTIKFVDEGIKQIEKTIREFYNDDGKSTFLMTSDHGMTDWGSHGTGDDHETQTPYVLWGAGVQTVKQEQIDPGSNDMSLDHRIDINQVDLSPLMSAILAIPVPVNSLGMLTTDLLNMSLGNKAKALYSNSRQLASQYNKKRMDVEANVISMLYYPFEPFTDNKYQEMIQFTEQLLMNKDYDKLILFSKEIINLSLQGLNYYHNYYQRSLLILVTLSFIGWIACLLKIITEQSMINYAETSSIKRSILTDSVICKLSINLIFALLFLISFYLVYVQCLPLQYYLYCFVPICLWWYILFYSDLWIHTFDRLKKTGTFSTVWIELLCYAVGAMAMGLSFSYRWILSAPLLAMGLWPFFSIARKYLSKFLLVAWFVSCALLSIFSFMPVIGKSVFIELVILAGIIWLIAMILYAWKILMILYQSKEEKKIEVYLTVLQIIILSLSLHNIYVQSKRFERGTSVSFFYQTQAWIFAVSSLVLPLVHSKRMICRLLSINTSLLNFYFLLSVSHEALFMVTLVFNISCWIFIELCLLQLKNTKYSELSFGDESGKTLTGFINVERSISNHDFRRAFFFTLYIILAFFGTGNIASLNSFEVRWVTCFITSFQPFIITGLILLKTLSPFLCVACSFRAIQHLTKAPIGYLNIIVLIYSNIMGIQLLFYVKNTGSWLEIGTSISQFVIVQVITLFIVLINQIAKILTDLNMYNFANKIFKSRKKYV